MTYQQGDVDALSQHLSRLVLEPELARQWAARASESGQQREWSATARRFAELFNEVCKERSK